MTLADPHPSMEFSIIDFFLNPSLSDTNFFILVGPGGQWFCDGFAFSEGVAHESDCGFDKN